ncbi:MAG: ABC transporter substrate-binding protein [Nitrospira sp.]|nr:ABC transporter substrate-binding protein [Nitrospira sp.]
MIPTPPDSWAILWDPRYKGRISMLNDQREVFGAVLRSMGQSDEQHGSAGDRGGKGAVAAAETFGEDLHERPLRSVVGFRGGWSWRMPTGGGPVARAMAELPVHSLCRPEGRGQPCGPIVCGAPDGASRNS